MSIRRKLEAVKSMATPSTYMCGIILTLSYYDDDHQHEVKFEAYPSGMLCTYSRDNSVKISTCCGEQELILSGAYPFKREYDFMQLRKLIFDLLAVQIPDDRRVIGVILSDFYQGVTIRRVVKIDSTFELDYYRSDSMMWKARVDSKRQNIVM